MREDYPIVLAKVAYRVYRNSGRMLKSDNELVFDGYSSKFDEWIPIFSPRIQPHLSKSNNMKVYKVKFNVDFDEVHLPDETG